MKKTFISYRHNTQSKYKEELLVINDKYNLFIDKSVNSGDISDSNKDETIRMIIRDQKLKDTTVTLLMYGEDINRRKFIDWEIAGSFIDYNDSYRNGLIIINMINNSSLAPVGYHINEVSLSKTGNYINEADSLSEEYWKNLYPHMPNRVIKNLAKPDVFIPIISWETIINDPYKFKNLIEKVANKRKNNNYDTSLPLRRSNS